MKSSALLLLLVACSSKSADAPVIVDKPVTQVAPPPIVKAATVDLAKVAALVPSGMETITRFGARSPITDMIGSLADAAAGSGATRPPCFATLAGKLTDLFAFGNIHTKRSVMVVVGDLPRKDVEACVAQAFAKEPYRVTVGADGDFVTFAMPDSEPIYAAWRDGAIVAGDKQIVMDVVAGARATEPWAQRLGALPQTFQMMEMTSIDPIATKLFGVQTIGYDMVGITERPAKAHVIIHATSAADATKIAGELTANTVNWGVELPPSFAAAMKKTTVVVHGNDVDVLVDQANFAGIPDEALAALGKALTGAE